MSAYVVLHSMVGAHMGGEVVEISPEHIATGVDPKRLLGLGALREATEDEAANAVPFGEGTEDAPRIFPPVPFENVTEVTASPEPDEAKTGKTK